MTRTWKHHNLTIGGGRNYFNGWGDLDTQQDGQLHRQLLWKPKEQYLANAAYTYTSDSGFRLQLASDLVREKLTNKGQAHVDPFSGYAIDEYYRTTRANNRLMLSGRLGKKGHWESRNGYALYHRTRSRLFRNMVNLEETPTQNAGDQDTSTFHDINLRSNYSNTYMRLKYDAGYDVNLEFARSGKIPGGTRQIGDYGLYQNFAYDLLPDKLTLQAGLREIYNTRYSAPFIYSFNALYTPAPKVQLRASYAKGFRAPTLKEQYLQFVDQNHYITGNPNLKAERSDALQASASWQVYERRSDYVQLILTGFYNNHYDKIILAKTDTFPANNKYQYVNLSRMQNVIGNLQMEQQWQNLHLVLEYGVQYYWKQAGLYDAYTVNEIVVRGQYYWSNPGLSFSAFYKLNGASPNIVEGIDGTVTTNGKLPSYSMLDLSLSKKFWNRRLELIAGVKNVLDVRQVTAAGAQQGGGPHGSESGGGVLLPRRLFTTLRLNL